MSIKNASGFFEFLVSYIAPSLSNSPWVDNPASFISEAMGDLHGYLMIWLGVVMWVCFSLSLCAIFPSIFGLEDSEAPAWLENFTNSFVDRHYSFFSRLPHNWVEILLVGFPVAICLILAVPAFHLLFISEEAESPALTVKVVAHQWYWTYELVDSEFESYLVADSDLNSAEQIRSLSTDSVIELPSRQPIRFLVTSADVLHSWAVPSLGVKVDAIPGRLNQVIVTANRPGIYHGQCSELCGAAHGFMPIEIKFA
jgi:Cytochrome C oxidase subunit II, periplasmic domain